MVLLFSLITLTLFLWSLRLTRKIISLRAEYAPIVDAEEYCKKLKQSAINEAMEQREKSDRLYSEAATRVFNEKEKLKHLNSETSLANEELIRINNRISEVLIEVNLIDVGFYQKQYEFDGITKYESELAKIQQEQKHMLGIDGVRADKINAAAFNTGTFYFDGSITKGEAAQKRIMKLMLRAFNGESDSFISRVNYRNIDQMEKKIKRSFEAINAITEKHYLCKINERYRDLKINELELIFEFEEAKQKEKEEQARIREQIREEEKAAREIEKEKLQTQKDEEKYQLLLKKAQDDVAAAADKDKAKLSNKIAELQEIIKQIEERKRTISQAELTKSGHVYIISNVGSFGQDIFKIGMTRRLEPMDRVKELGDASVPFPFDVHAMISTTDAPSLENALHNHFKNRRINLENQRKEFFNVSIQEIKDELDLLKDSLGIHSELRLTLLAEAKEYRLSEARRRHLEESLKNNN